MKAVLIFDTVNDLLFSKWDDEFLLRMKSFNGHEKDVNITDSHHVSQMLSPIITSQRVMAAQFSNTYTSMQCKDNTTIVFDEWLDHVFMIISEDEVDDSHQELLDCKTLVQHICGQNINLLHSSIYQDWLSVLLESRGKGDSIPGASGVFGQCRATGVALNALKSISKDIKCSPNQHYHLMIFVGNKMLALYSSRGCEDLMPPDVILLSIQCIAAQEYWQELREIDDGDVDDNTHIPWLSEENSAIVNLCAGSTGSPCAPHSLHLAEIAPRIIFACLIDMELRDLGIAVHMSSQILSNLRRLLLQRNLEVVPSTLDSLDVALKKTTEALRKSKSNAALLARVGGRQLELRRACAGAGPLAPDTAAAALRAALDAAAELLRPHIPSLRLAAPRARLAERLAPVLAFLRAKALRYFGIVSEETEGASEGSLAHKYVEEFPGLVHFVFVDRLAARALAPELPPRGHVLSRRAVQRAVAQAARALREGYGAALWRCGALHVCAVRWFERRAAPLRPAAPPHPAAVRALPPPADIRGAFYRQLTELAFPNDSQGVTVKELICIHLGLLPASTAVQQARRLAHSVNEMTGENMPFAPDLL